MRLNYQQSCSHLPKTTVSGSSNQIWRIKSRFVVLGCAEFLLLVGHGKRMPVKEEKTPVLMRGVKLWELSFKDFEKSITHAHTHTCARRALCCDMTLSCALDWMWWWWWWW